MLITIGSVTTAAKVAKTIENTLGVAVSVVYTPSELNKGGCSYSIRFNDKYESEVQQLVAEYKLPVRKWYTETYNGRRRVYNAVPR